MGKWTQTVTAKVLGIGALALLMTIPLLQVRELVSERQQLRSDAISQIAQGWGGKQVIGGPVLVVPTLRQVTVEGQLTPRWQTGSALIGITNAAQLDENLAALGRPLDAEVNARIDHIRWEIRDPAQ